jgi:two-component system sensor histidine kinase KdpD
MTIVAAKPAAPSATAEPGSSWLVLLGGLAAGNRVELHVVDHGPGIPAADRRRVFQPFCRLGDPGDRTGAGLGLAVARGLAETMGGTVEPEDTPGGGLTMVLTLPAAPARPAAETRPTAEARGTRRIRAA